MTPRRDEGYSLVELAVSMMVASIVLAAVATTTIGSWRTLQTVRSASEGGDGLRTTLEALERPLRTATVPAGAASALVSADRTSVSFWSLLNRTGSASVVQPAPTRVDVTWTGGCVRRTLAPPTGAATSQCLLRTTTAPTFSYATSADGLTGTLTATPLSATDLAAVRSVGIELTASSATSRVPVSARVRVTLVNLLVTP